MITLLTYDSPHRKTQDVGVRLLSHGIRFRVVATPWVDRRPRRFIYAHRPSELTWPCESIGDPSPFFKNMGIEYLVCDYGELDAVLHDRVVVIGGAGILKKNIVEGHIVVNVHPGLLPASRGLDILKWDVIELNRVGATAHICDSDTDLGWRLMECRIPVFPNDTFHSFAMRQYEMELGMIPQAIELLDGKSRTDFEKVDREDTIARRRMGRREEACLLERFELFKRIYAR